MTLKDWSIFYDLLRVKTCIFASMFYLVNHVIVPRVLRPKVSLKISIQKPHFFHKKRDTSKTSLSFFFIKAKSMLRKIEEQRIMYPRPGSDTRQLPLDSPRHTPARIGERSLTIFFVVLCRRQCIFHGEERDTGETMVARWELQKMMARPAGEIRARANNTLKRELIWLMPASYTTAAAAAA
jgi:hypothetical protein